MNDRAYAPLMQRLALAIDGRPWLNLPHARKIHWRRVAGLVIGTDGATETVLRARLESLAAEWEEAAAHKHGDGELVCQMCVTLKRAARDLRKVLR